MNAEPLGKQPNDIKMSPFGTLVFVQGWCPHCQEFHPKYNEAQKWLAKLHREGHVFPQNFQMESVEAQPPHRLGDGVPTMIMIFNNKLVPLKSRFWADGEQLKMALFSLYGPFFQRWKENQKRIIQNKEPRDYEDIVQQTQHDDDDQYRDYNDFIHELPEFLESMH